MKIILYHRHYGLHAPHKHGELSLKLEDVYRGEDLINEDVLIAHLPEQFLPVPPKKCLLTVVNYNKTGEKCGATGQRGLKLFMNWAKYFDAYVLELQR